jgi:hypothetical protein
MYVASLSWTTREISADELRRRYRLRYHRYLATAGISVFSIFFAAAAFLMPHWTVVLAAVACNSMVLLALLEGRILR